MGADRGRGNLLGVEPWLSVEDYRSATAREVTVISQAADRGTADADFEVSSEGTLANCWL